LIPANVLSRGAQKLFTQGSVSHSRDSGFGFAPGSKEDS